MSPLETLTPNQSRSRRRWRYSSVELLATLVLLFVFTPFIEGMRNGPRIEALLLTLVFISAVFAVGAKRSTLWTAAVLVVPALLARWLESEFAPAFPVWVFPPLAMIFVGYVIWQLVRSAIQARQVDAEVLCAAITAYLFLGLLWATAYLLLGRVSPEAFYFAAKVESTRTMDSFNAFYFSFVTLSTIGFGDIAPVSKGARMLAVTEAMTGLFYITVLIARLVAVYSTNNPKLRESK